MYTLICNSVNGVILKQVQLHYLYSLYLGLASISIVTLSGGQNCRNCSTDGGDGTHANPGDMISINCAIDNPDNLVNSLVWSISSFGVSITNTDGNDADDVDQSDFVSTVNDFNDTLSTTNATLTFPAISDLDEAVVKCRGAQTDTAKECTLCIKSKYMYSILQIIQKIVNIYYIKCQK